MITAIFRMKNQDHFQLFVLKAGKTKTYFQFFVLKAELAEAIHVVNVY